MTSTARVSGHPGKTRSTPYQMYIGNQFVDALNGRTFQVFNPATEEVIATCPAADARDIDRAVGAATSAFYGGWKAVTAQERGRGIRVRHG